MKKQREKEKNKGSDGRSWFWYYKLSMLIIPPKIRRNGSVNTWYIQGGSCSEGSFPATNEKCFFWMISFSRQEFYMV